MDIVVGPCHVTNSGCGLLCVYLLSVTSEAAPHILHKVLQALGSLKGGRLLEDSDGTVHAIALKVVLRLQRLPVVIHGVISSKVVQLVVVVGGWVGGKRWVSMVE